MHAIVFLVDRAVMSFFVDHRTPGLTAAAVILDFIGSVYGIGLMLLCLTVWLWRKDERWAVNLALGTIGLVFLVELIKIGVARPRPQDQLFIEHNFSFPSSHSTLAVFFFGWLTVIVSRYARPAFRSAAMVVLPVLILLIGLSRIYLGAHWPSDVIAGFCLGSGALLYSLRRVRILLPSLAVRAIDDDDKSRSAAADH